AEAREAVTEPCRRGPDGDVDDRGGPVVWTSLEVLDLDANERIDVERGHASRLRRFGRRPRELEEGGELARKANMSERVGTVRRDAQLEDDVLRTRDGLHEGFARP